MKMGLSFGRTDRPVKGTCLMPASERRKELFQDERYGIFVHWGPIAGHGKAGHLARKTHDDIAVEFEGKATDFDADRWVETFRSCGARYLTIVPKHGHDFCLWPTEDDCLHTRRDFLGEIDRACRNHGVPLFLYLNLNAAGFEDLAHNRDFTDWPDRPPRHVRASARRPDLPGGDARSDRRRAIGSPGGLFGGPHRPGRHDHSDRTGRTGRTAGRRWAGLRLRIYPGGGSGRRRSRVRGGDAW